MALSVASAANNGNNRTDFSAALTPMEFIAKYGASQHALGVTANKKLLALSCKDNRGVITSAYASKNLQEKFDATPEGEKFRIPENTMVAPWVGNDGSKHWTLYLQSDLDLMKSASDRIEQI